MDRTLIRLFQEKTFRDPVFIDLSSEAGTAPYEVGITLLENTRAERIGEVYSPHLPDYAISEESGLCHLPRFDIYAATKVTPNLVILTGAEHLDPDDVQAHYELADIILKNATAMGCRRFATCTAIRSKKAEEKIYIAATNSAETIQITERHGGKPFSLGRIMIPTGPLLGLARTNGHKVLCIIGIIAEDQTEEETAQLLYDYLVGALELKTEQQ